MNKYRRKELEKISLLVEASRSLLEEILNEEQEAFDNLPESLQYSEKGERMEEIIGYLEDSLIDLESAIENINMAIE